MRSEVVTVTVDKMTEKDVEDGVNIYGGSNSPIMGFPAKFISMTTDL